MKNRGLSIFIILMIISIGITIYFGVTDNVYNGFRVGLWSIPTDRLLLNPETDYREVFNPLSPNIWLLVISSIIFITILVLNFKGKIKNWKNINAITGLWVFATFVICGLSASGAIFK